MDDISTYKAYCNGNNEALACLYLRYKKPLINFTYKTTHSIQDAEDAVQNTFIKLAGKPEFNPKKRASFKARHAKNIAKGKMSAAYWANKSKW